MIRALSSFAGLGLLVAGVVAWIVFLLLDPLCHTIALPFLALPLALVVFLLVIGLVLLIPARRWGTALKTEWIALGRHEPEALKDFLQHNVELLKRGKEGARIAESLLNHLAATSCKTSGEQADALLTVLESQVDFKSEWLSLLEGVESSAGHDYRVLLAYDLVSAFGLRLDGAEIDRRIKAVLSESGQRGHRPLSLLYERAEDGSDPARLLVIRMLNERKMKLQDLPATLSDLREDQALDPRLIQDPLYKRLWQRLSTVRIPRLPRFSLPDLSVKKAAPLAAILLVALVIALLPRERSAESPVENHGLKHQASKATTMGFTIQVMASKDSSQARQEVDRLEQAGYWAYLLAPRPNSSWYRVRLGHFNRRAEADSVASGLKLNGIIKDSYVANYEQ